MSHPDSESPLELPIDVLESVADSLVGFPVDMRTLGTMSLTCRHLSSYCRRHMFSTIFLLPRMLDDYEGRHLERHLRLKTMENLVASSQEIPSYVHSLVILMHSSNFNDGGFPRLLTKFGQIQKLTLRTLHVNGQRSFQNWTEMPHETQEALWNLISQQRSTLEDLDFYNFIDIPTATILTLTRLQNLRLMESQFHPVMEPPHNYLLSEEPLQIESLAFTRNYQSIAPVFYSHRPNGGNAILDLSHLKLFIGIYDPSPDGVFEEEVPHLLKEMGQLENLDLSSETSEI